MQARTKNRLIWVAAVAGVGLAIRSAGAVPTPLLEYRFNETGTSAASGGSVASQGLTLYNSAKTATELHSADAGGISGLAGDRALDATAATAMGSAGTGPLGESAGTPPITGLKSLTVTGWFKTDGSQVTDKARILDMGNLTVGGGDVANGGQPGNLSIQINGSGGTTTLSGANYTAASTWTYFAITADLTTATNNIKFYAGNAGTPVSLVATGSSAQTTAGANTFIQVANRDDRSRPYDGLLDDIRLFGTTADNTGVLSATDLESIRLADLTNSLVPEPASMGLFGLGGLLLLRRRRA